MSGYEYDVFLSYRRGQRLAPGGEWSRGADGNWVHKVFFPKFKQWLEQEYPEVRIAFDGDLPLGSPWEQTMKHWLRHSKCLVAVWSSPYFRSGFCRSEFHSMLHRQRMLRPDDSEGPGLVVPLAFYDGDSFDDEAKALQYFTSFTQFSRYDEPIRDEQVKQAEFTVAMQQFCAAVARSIRAAPAFKKSFKWVDVEPLPPAHAYGVPRLQ